MAGSVVDTECVIVYPQGKPGYKSSQPTGAAEDVYSETYDTMPQIKPPIEEALGLMFLDGVKNGVELCGTNVCHGVLICSKPYMKAYGNELFLGVVYGCVACCGLTLDN